MLFTFFFVFSVLLPTSLFFLLDEAVEELESLVSQGFIDSVVEGSTRIPGIYRKPDRSKRFVLLGFFKSEFFNCFIFWKRKKGRFYFPRKRVKAEEKGTVLFYIFWIGQKGDRLLFSFIYIASKIYSLNKQYLLPLFYSKIILNFPFLNL